MRSRAEERAGAPVSETVRQGERALKFTQGALRAIAREALKCKSGARGLHAIISSIMVDLMYEIPSQPNIKEGTDLGGGFNPEGTASVGLNQKTAETA